MATITKKDLVAKVVEACSLSKNDAYAFVEDFFEVMGLAMENGKEVKVSGFGNFTLRDKNSRMGRNPRTNEEFEITARRVVSFHPSNMLRKKVNG